MLKKCKECFGSGLLEVGGFIKDECWYCDGRGKVVDKDAEYKSEIDRIKGYDASITDDQAKQIYDQARVKAMDELEKEGKHGRRKAKL